MSCRVKSEARGALLIAAGAAGLVYHTAEIAASLVRVLAIVAGVFLLRGQNWARWLATAWIAFHVVLSAFHSATEFGMHVVLCAVLGFFLFRRDASSYFLRTR